MQGGALHSAVNHAQIGAFARFDASTVHHRYRIAPHVAVFSAHNRGRQASSTLVAFCSTRRDGHTLLAQLLGIVEVCWMMIGASPGDSSSSSNSLSWHVARPNRQHLLFTASR
ncbi:hypothetical protein KCP73_14065 [Salmonella enterica subsp. enterica]|nr:hypothetical protein KCP73_14065 [Salmonella enterica subsp. enterica]